MKYLTLELVIGIQCLLGIWLILVYHFVEGRHNKK
jgi:hypothetical protein